jgi:hypothetical protein
LHITIMNGSTRVTNNEAATAAGAIAHQVAHDFAPAWHIRGAGVSFLARPPARAPSHVLTIVDAIADEPAGVLGYHTETATGSQFSVVAAAPILDAGGRVLDGDWSVASVISHEACEWLGDAACNLWAADDHGRMFSYEACDPVEAPTYLIDGVSVSNFVTPEWFDPHPPARARFDHLGLLGDPFSLLPGGYLVWVDTGGEHQEFGAEFPAWRKEMKAGPHARTRRRMVQGAKLAF